MDEYKIEYEQNSEIPMSLDTTYIRPPGLFSKIIPRKDIPVNRVEKYESNGQVKFEVNTTYFLNPFTLFLTFDFVNEGSAPLQLDGSAHSLIKKIEVRYKNTGKILEVIDDYDIVTNLYFDLHLNKKDRRERRENEGFGDNEYGSNEVIIPPKVITKTKKIEEISSLSELAKIEDNQIFINTKEKNDLEEMKNQEYINNFDVEMKNINDWAEVKDGKLRPEAIEKKDIFNNRNIVHFRVPLQLKTIGQAIQPDNFKYIPMAVIGPIIITITLNPDGVFVPLKINKIDYYSKDEQKILSKYLDNPKKQYKLEKMNLEYELNQFSTKATEELFNHVKNGEFILDHTGLEFINHFYVLPYPTIDGTSEFKEKKEIKAMYLIFLTDLYQHTPYSRKQARHNKGFKRIELTYKNKKIPEVPTEHNSLCTYGDKNCNYFWDQLAKAIETQNSLSSDKTLKTVLSKTNFCLNYSLSEAVALNHYSQKKNIPYELMRNIYFMDDVWLNTYLTKAKANILLNKYADEYHPKDRVEKIEDFENDIPDFQNKSIFTFNFDDMKYSYGLYRNGIKVQPNDKFKLSLHRIDNYPQYDQFKNFNEIYTYLYIFVEYYESLVLNIDGKFVSY